jgi:hypothetical protein
MIVEERIYTLQIGKVPEYLQLYETEGKPIQTRYLTRMVGYYATECGPLNQVIQLWAYETFEERLQRRAAMRADAGWPVYLRKVRPLIVAQESKLLIPAPFFEPSLRLCFPERGVGA